MNKKLKKVIQYTLRGIFLLVVLLLFAIGIALNYVFTPEKITPQIVSAINANLNAKFEVDSIEITFFSSFPRFSLEMKNGVVLNRISLDSIQSDKLSKQDSLISFDKCLITVDPIAFLRKKEIKVHQVIIDRPNIVAFVNKEGVPNWDILKSTELQEEENVVDEADTTKFKADLNIKGISITNADVIYFDRLTKVFARINEYDLSLNAIYNTKNIQVGVVTNSKEVIFWQEGETLLKKLTAGVSANLNIDRATKVMEVRDTKVTVNEVEFLVDGQLIPDKKNKKLGVNLDFKLEVPSLEKLMMVVPESVWKQDENFKMQGRILFDANVKGNYGKGELPIVDVNLEIKNGGLQYRDKNAAKVNIQKINFFAGGQLVPSIAEKRVGVNMEIKLDIPSSKELMINIPENIWERNKKMAVKSQVSANAKVQGDYSKNNMPTVDGIFSLKDLDIDIHSTKDSIATINNIEFLADGQLSPNLQKQEVEMNMDLSLAIPSLESLSMLVPDKILKQYKNFNTQGQLAVNAKLKGVYGNGKLPTIDAKLNLKEGSLQYLTRPNKIELIETDMTAFIDFSKKISCTLNVNNFKVKGLGTNLALSGKADNIFDNPEITAKSKGVINFDALSKMLPSKLGVEMHGLVDLDLTGTFLTNEILNSDYGKIDAIGKVKLSDIKFHYKKANLIFESKLSTAIFGQKQKSKILTGQENKVFGGVVDMLITKLVKDGMTTSFEKIHVDFVSTPWEDRNRIVNIQSTLTLENGQFNFADTLKGTIGYANAIIHLNPSEKDPSVPTIHTAFQVDSTGFTTNGNFIGIKEGDFNLDLIRKAPKQWQATGFMAFNSLYAYTPLFPLLIKMPKTKVSISPSLIELNEAKMVIGNSDIEVTGKVHNFEKTFLEKKTLRAELSINSKMIDVNQLIKTLNEGVTLEEEMLDELIASEELVVNKTIATQMETFVVPKGIDFTLESKLAKVVFGDLEIDDTYGLIEIKNQNIRLVDLRMKTLAADMETSVRYAAKNKTDASLDFDFGLTDIDIKKLVQLMPALDTLFPMAESFEGNVNFIMQGKCQLDAQMGFDLPTLEAIARIEGQNMILLDGETFSQLSKTLMFKNKDKNTIDSLSFEMMIQGNKMEVFPSILTVDRYRVAIGGYHKLDMTYDYHVSVLKSPMPFKAGIDITGNLEDYDFKITKAKYKYLFSDKKRHQAKADNSILKRKEAILEKLKF